MTRSIRETVEEYCQPIRPRLKRPFSETHISRNIQAQRLESGVVHPLQSISEANKDSAESPDDQTMNSDSISYRPNSPETEASFQKFTDRLFQILENNGVSPVDETEMIAATNAALFALKHGLYVDDEKRDESISVLNSHITGPDLQFLQSLADALHDYPLDQSLISDDATLADKSIAPQTPKAQYRDVEQITADTLTAHTYTGIDVPPVDILVRTSGVERLSDFLLWQIHENTDIKFVKCMWPEFGLKQFLPILLEWQWRIRKEEVWDSANWAKVD
jgi:hypothetical protein